MDQQAIVVQKISKLYTLGKAKSGNFRESFSQLLTKGNKEDSEFWALKDVSFELGKGKVLGVVGRNGAGKSTLLKILSRITEPTHGRIEINGRMGSLLEVGTGFHPELTGRENIFLNGSILGMKRAEIRSRFDDIIEFAGIEKFIDTPVKRYSSGMYVRLAFAVAAHLEPEILIIDEVLAVGDIAFQKKCLGKMQDIAGHGRTVLFVSHNLQAVRSLCTECIFLKNGQLVVQGPTDEVLALYDQSLRSTVFNAGSDVNNEKNRRGTGDARYSGIELVDENGDSADAFLTDEPACFRLKFKVFRDMPELFASIALRSGITRELITTIRYKLPFKNLQKNETYHFEVVIDGGQLRPGEYPLYFWLGDENAQAFDVVDDAVAPLTITTRGSFFDLGYDPSVHSGYFSARSTIKIMQSV
jgi:lipopolysaccharide transport system ATP-binding protein